MARIAGYGARVYRNAIDLRSDRRPRVRSSVFGRILEEGRPRGQSVRGEIKAFSRASRRRLAFTFANTDTPLRTMATLTYHAVAESWEGQGDVNRRIVQRSKRDLNRFLTAMRPQLGAYLWVQEFQTRGVLHYHLVCERELSPPEVSMVWCRTVDEFDDAAARKYAVLVEPVREQVKVCAYLGSYLGKLRQKQLPQGVDGAGRWWGASRSVHLVVLDELVACELKARKPKEPETRAVRCLRRFISRLVGFDYKGGMLIDWKGETCARAARALKELVRFYGRTESLDALLAKFEWEGVDHE